MNNNGSPTPRRYASSRPDFNNYEDRDNRYMNPREKLIPREYYENVRTVDELLAEIKMLSRQLREQQDRELKLRNLCETLKGKLSKYFEFRELAFKYKQQRDELSYKLYRKNIYTDTDGDSDNDDLGGFELSDVNTNSNDDQIYISKRKNNIHNRNNNNKSSISPNKSELNNKNDNDSETKELINKLYEMITSLKQTNITMSPQSNNNDNKSSNSSSSSSSSSNNNDDGNDSMNNNNTNNKSKYLSERDLDIIKTEELKKLEDAVQEYRHKLEAKKAYERRKISAQQEILQIQEELKNLDTGFGPIDNNNTNNTKYRVKFTESRTRNEPIRPKSRNKSTIRERFDNIGNEFDETSFFQTNST